MVHEKKYAPIFHTLIHIQLYSSFNDSKKKQSKKTSKQEAELGHKYSQIKSFSYNCSVITVSIITSAIIN